MTSTFTALVVDSALTKDAGKYAITTAVTIIIAVIITIIITEYISKRHNPNWLTIYNSSTSYLALIDFFPFNLPNQLGSRKVL
ncbi:MAG: hypothetical protein ACTHKP_16085 [Nitrososphaeraceae archaeon]